MLVSPSSPILGETLKNISTLVHDIQELITSGKYDAEIQARFSTALGETVTSRLDEKKREPSLRLSNLGTPNRKLWYSINKAEAAEKLPPAARLKFLFGDILEEVLLYLAEQAGHSVTDRQREVEVNGVRGHIDCIIDGELVDVKSASSYSFKKFASNGLRDDDPFGYITQLSGYAHALDKTRGHFLVVDKTLGKICLDTYEFPKADFSALVDQKREMLSFPLPPERCYPDEAETHYRKPTGNRKLSVACSYCPFKATCWPGLSVYSGTGDKPIFYTVIGGEPKGRKLKLSEVEL